MEKILRVVDGFGDAEEADYEYFASLTPAQRFALAMDLMEPFYAAAAGLERISRIVELSQSPVLDSWGLGHQLSGGTEDHG